MGWWGLGDRVSVKGIFSTENQTFRFSIFWLGVASKFTNLQYFRAQFGSLAVGNRTKKMSVKNGWKVARRVKKMKIEKKS